MTLGIAAYAWRVSRREHAMTATADGALAIDGPVSASDIPPPPLKARQATAIPVEVGSDRPSAGDSRSHGPAAPIAVSVPVPSDD
jgi:hypothetical protein